MASADVAALIKPGSILLIYCHFCDPPKPKFFVVAAVNPFPVGFFINSEPTRWQQQTKHLMDAQVKIARADYAGFLKHDSWIDCTEAIDQYEMAELVAAVAADPAKKLLGHLTGGDVDRVCDVVKDSLSIEASNIKIILRDFGKMI